MSDPDTHMTSTPPSSSSLLSPPTSQEISATSPMPTVSPAVNGANSNGKRPHTALSVGEDRDEAEIMSGNGVNGSAGGGKARQEFPTKTHAQSGYSWSRVEDEPGYGWMNKKALDEANRAWDSLVHRDAMVKGRYGDSVDVGEKEKALVESMTAK